MAFQTTYKKLATVRVLHSFYLDGKDETSFYERPVLEQEEALSHYNIMADIDFVPTEQTLKLMNAYAVKWHPFEQGFFVGIQVDPLTQPNYKPMRRLPDDGSFKLVFQLILKNSQWRNFTNIRLRPTDLPFGFYATNDDSDKKNYPPSVSTPVKPFSSGRKYEMGEIILKDNKVYRALIQNDVFNTTNWQAIDAAHFHNNITESDCRALPTPFAKIVKPKEIQAKGIVFSDDIQAPRCLGIIEIVHRAGILDGYNLLDTEGSVLPKGQTLEVRFLNRLTHWKYLEAKKDTLSAFRNGTILDDNLITRQPHFLTKTLTEIKLNDDIKLPSPTRLNISEKNDRFYTEIVY